MKRTGATTSLSRGTTGRRRSFLVGVSLVALLVALLPGALRAQEQKAKTLRPQNLPIARKQLDAPAPVDDLKAVEVIERYLEAIGGLAVLKAVEDRTMTFETIKHAMAGETKAELKLFLKNGYKVREEWDLPGFKISTQKLQFVQVYDGFDGWVQMFGTVSPLEGRTLSIFVWDKPINDFFCHWKSDGYSVNYVDESELDGDPVDVIMTTDFHGKSTVRYFFSATTGLLLKKEWKDQDPKGVVTKSTFYSNYRDIPFKNDSTKRIKVALLQKIFIEKTLDTERKYTQIALNSGLSDAIFERPEGVEFTGGIGRGAKKGGVDPRTVFQQFEENQGGDKEAGAVVPQGSGSTSTGPAPVQVPVGKKNPHGKNKKS